MQEQAIKLFKDAAFWIGAVQIGIIAAMGLIWFVTEVMIERLIRKAIESYGGIALLVTYAYHRKKFKQWLQETKTPIAKVSQFEEDEELDPADFANAIEKSRDKRWDRYIDPPPPPIKK